MKRLYSRFAIIVGGTLLVLAPSNANALQGGNRGQAQGGRGQTAPPIVPQDPATLKRDSQGHPDFTGMWNVQYTPDITTAVPGGQLPFTAYGAERWKNVDTKDDPTGLCLPVGPSRAFTAPFPVYFLQTSKVIGALFEYQTTWRMFYVDGTHPEDLGDYGSEFMGHSIAHWEGDALVADTIGINERSWLDTAGHEHSDKLHLNEKFEKITDDGLQMIELVLDAFDVRQRFGGIRRRA